MKKFPIILVLAVLLLNACNNIPAPTTTQEPPALITPKDVLTATQPPIVSWEITMQGLIYDATTDKPIEGASVHYTVLSRYPELREGLPDETLSDAEGRFSLPTVVHDTDSLHLIVEAPGYTTYEQEIGPFTGGTLYEFNIGLTP
ncbi:MAG: carboxypeptidase regulatory-like domain-containing protein [Anaerolineae bacterium]|nr:carboxypeptidase regulatory-like domain-containing protein [Anaerolineae bacterium]